MNDGDSGKVINLEQRRRQTVGGEPEVDPGVQLPEFIRPSDISTLSDEQLEGLLNVIRLRRLTSTMLYEKTMKDKEEITQGKARDMLDNKCGQVYKEIEKAFKQLEKLELRVNEMRALRIQAGLDW